jgi:hypothetical protein
MNTIKTFPLKKAKLLAALLVALTIGSNCIAGDACRAQGPDGRSFGASSTMRLAWSYSIH